MSSTAESQVCEGDLIQYNRGDFQPEMHPPETWQRFHWRNLLLLLLLWLKQFGPTPLQILEESVRTEFLFLVWAG
jgi:hypothetical protein